MTCSFPVFRLQPLTGLKSIATTLLLGVFALVAGCGGDGGGSVLPPPTLTSISVGPPAATLAAGLTSQYSATGVFNDGSKKDISSTVTWSSSTPAAATISTSGLAKGVAAGSTTITATSGAVSGTATLAVTAATLVSIGVTPATPSIGVGTSQQFTATGVYTDGTTQDLTTMVTFSSGTPSVATISAAGLATGVAPGASVITATPQSSAVGSVTGTTTLEVTAATLISIGITPGAATLANGTTQQFVATAVYSDKSTHVVTTDVTWTSSVPATATIGNMAGTNGLAKALAVGSTAITASLAGVTSPAVTLTVTPATLVSIGVTPANPSVPLGGKLQFVAMGTYTDNSTQTLTTAVTWSSSVPATATISNAAGFDGQASSVAVGTTAITATLGGVSSAPVTLSVTPAALVSIGVTPANPTIFKGNTLQFVAMGVYTDNSTQTLTTAVTWNSGTPAIAAISNAVGSKGLATAAAAGTTAITASLGGVTSPAVTLTVSPAALVSITVTPTAASIAAGLTQQFTATGTYSDGTTPNITTQVTWSSSNTAAATISNAAGSNGLATGVASGTTSITASVGAISSTPARTLTVTPATLVSIAVTAPTLSIPLGLTDQFTATGTYTDTTTQNITTSVTWSSATPATASISNAGGTQGKATSHATGTTLITATDPVSGIASNVTLTVTPASLLSIAVTPTNPSILVDTDQQFTAIGTYTDGTMPDLTTTATWASTTASAQISNAAGSQGLATGLAAGTASITATYAGITSTPAATLTVAAATQYAYVSDFQNGVVDEYAITAAGTLVPLNTPFLAASVNPSALAVDPTGHYLFVTNEGPGSITQYSIGTNGQLTAHIPDAPAGAQPSSISIDSTGTYAYVANFNNGGPGTVSQYTIVGGLLVPMTPATITAGGGTSVVALDPTAAFAYVANYTDGTIMVFTVGVGGALSTTPVSMVTLTGTTTTHPNSMVIDSTGSYLYVADYGNATIGQFSINSSTGALTPLANPYVSQVARTITLYGGYVYASDYDQDAEVVYQIGTGGDLGAPVQTYNFAGGTGPNYIAFDQTGSFAYVADRGVGGALSQFTVNGGSIAAQSPPTVAMPIPPAPYNGTPRPLYIVTSPAHQ